MLECGERAKKRVRGTSQKCTPGNEEEHPASRGSQVVKLFRLAIEMKLCF